MRKTVTLYQPVGSIYGDAQGYSTYDAAQSAIAWMPTWYPEGGRIDPMQFDLPDDAFWENDLISIELHRGGHDDGEKWFEVTGRVHVLGVELRSKIVYGRVADVETGQQFQNIRMRAGEKAFAYRNAKLLQPNVIED